MMWVCRAGQKSVFADYYFSTKKIYIPWDGFKYDLLKYQDREALKMLVLIEKGDVARASVSNWAGQLYTFCHEMNIGDYVLIPFDHSKQFVLARISGDYEYSSENDNVLWHSRLIEIIVETIPCSIFNQQIRYSLGAYRTIFRAKYEKGILAATNKYLEKEGIESGFR